MGWEIPPRPEMEMDAVTREQYWSQTHVEEDYETVWSMTEDDGVRARILSGLRDCTPLEVVAVPGCGSRAILEKAILKEFPSVEVWASDFADVVAVAKERSGSSRLTYVARDSSQLGWSQECDAIVIVNSILSESDRENRAMLSSSLEALRPGGLLVGFFPNVLATVDIAAIEGSADRMSLVDLARSSFREQVQGIEQIFYTPLRLRKVLNDVGFQLESMETFFCDSKYFVNHSRDYYGISDPDLVIYENLVMARRPSS